MKAADWLVPVLLAIVALLIGGGLLFIARRRAVLTTRALIGIELSDSAFEEALTAGLRLQGYHIEAVQQSLIVMRRSGEVTLVSYRHWNRTQSGKQRLRELRRAMRQQHAAGGKLVSSIDLPNWFLSESETHTVEWLGPRELTGLLELGIAQESPRTVQLITSFMPGHLDEPPSVVDVARRDAGQNCPRCGAAMTLEVATQGQAQGRQFWRCVRVGECKGIRVAQQV